MSLDEQNNANAAAELAALKTKFETWQKKAKTAVAKQREMYDLLSKELLDTKAEGDKMKSDHAENVSLLNNTIIDLQQEVAELRKNNQILVEQQQQPTHSNSTDGEQNDLETIRTNEIYTLKCAKDELDVKINALERDILQLQASNTSLSAENNQLLADLESASRRAEGEDCSAHNESLIAEVQVELLQQSQLLQRTQLWADFLDSRCTVLSRAACMSAPVTWSALKEVRTKVIALQHELSAASQQSSSEGRLKEQIQRIQSEFDKYKARSESALQLLNDEVDELQQTSKEKDEQIQSMQQDMKATQDEFHLRDQTIATLENQLEDAAEGLLKLQTELQDAKDAHVQPECQHDNLLTIGARDHFNDNYDDGEAHAEAIQNLTAEHNAVTAAMAEHHNAEMQTLQSELMMLRMRVAMFQSKSSNSSSHSDDAYVTTLLQQLEEAQNRMRDVEMRLKEQSNDNERLKAQIAILEGKAKGHSAGMHTANTASKNMNVEDLHRMLIAKSEQLWQANQEVLQLRAIAAASQQQQNQSSLRGASGSSGGRSSGIDAAQSAYLRAILVKIFCEEDERLKGALMPVLATVVQWSTEELRAIYHANPEWRTV